MQLFFESSEMAPLPHPPLANTLPATRRDEGEVAIVGVLADDGGDSRSVDAW